MADKPKYQSTKILPRTIKNLRILSALVGKTHLEIMDELVDSELERAEDAREKERHKRK